MNRTANTIDQMQAVNARLQEMFDRDYGLCLVSRNDVVPKSLLPRILHDPPAIDPDEQTIDTSTTPALHDPSSLDAKRYVSREAGNLVAGCPGETIQVDAHMAPIAPGMVSRLVGLTEPHGGGCLGSLGEVDYLVVKRRTGWSTLLSGYLGILPTTHAGYRDIELRGHGTCVFQYGWTGKRYAGIRSTDCGGDLPPDLGNPGDGRRDP